MRQLFCLCLFSLLFGGWAAAPAVAQERVHLVFFRDKAGSPFSLNRPGEFLSQRSVARRSRQNLRLTERDLPVSPAHLDSVRRTGARVLYPTRWFNGAIIAATDAQAAAVDRLSVVRAGQSQRLSPTVPAPLASVAPLPVPALPAPVPESYGGTQNQVRLLGADAMHRAGFRGEGIQIAVFDETFPGVARAFPTTRVLGTYNMVQGGNNVFTPLSDHGSQVLGMLAANLPGQAIGTAYRADFYLFITEDVATETRAEEAWWLAAAERADSLGVDVISTSVGYSTFNDPAQNYTVNDLNGNTALVTRAADLAAAVGMVVVKAAGNAGNGSWQKITFPGDADSILTVGAVDAQGRYASFSSRGPTADGRVKPDVAAQGSAILTVSGTGTVLGNSGTSFAAPSVAGLVAGLWQANPTLTNMQVIDFVRRSGSRFRIPNDSTGYGIPSFERAQFLVTSLDEPELAREQAKLYPSPFSATLYLALGPGLAGRPTELAVTDVLGRQVYRAGFVADGRVLELRAADLALAPGAYLVRVRAGDFQRVFRVMKE
jgi:subtilisin family serine protease